MVTGKMLINESHKNFSNVSFHISTIRGIDSNNLSLTSLTVEWTWNISDIFKKSTILITNQELLYRSDFYRKSSQKLLSINIPTIPHK